MPTSALPLWPGQVENASAIGRIIFVCEHASNDFPPQFGSLGLSEAQKTAHIAWDPGALGLARGLARRMDGLLIAAPVSRLIYDCNRPPDSPGSTAARSEQHEIPGNSGLSAAERLARTEAVYQPFHDSLRRQILRRLVLGPAPVIVTIHSFTRFFHGRERAVEFGVIHDADPSLAQAVLRAARDLPLVTRLNEPYSAANEVTHTLRLHAMPYGLTNVMLEVRNDLIASPSDQERLADSLAAVLTEALDSLDPTGAKAPTKTKTG